MLHIGPELPADTVCQRPSAIYYGSGYISRLDFWRLGAIFGLIFLAALMLIGVPYLNWFLSLT